MSTIEKYERLVDLVYHRTKLSGIQWKWNEGLGHLSATLKESEIILSESQNEKFEPIYTVSIRYQGKIVDKFDDDTLASTQPKDFPSYFLKLDSIFEMAKRQATGADIGLDVALSELDDLIPF